MSTRCQLVKFKFGNADKCVRMYLAHQSWLLALPALPRCMCGRSGLVTELMLGRQHAWDTPAVDAHLAPLPCAWPVQQPLVWTTDDALGCQVFESFECEEFALVQGMNMRSGHASVHVHTLLESAHHNDLN